MGLDEVSLNKVLAPNVAGSKVPDGIFSDNNSSAKLDVFVLFSLVASTFSNPGPSDYHTVSVDCESATAQSVVSMHSWMVSMSS